MNTYKKLEYGTINDEDISIKSIGIKKELGRTFSTFATFGLAFSNIGILSSTSSTFQTALQRGGPITILLCWNIVAFFMICVALSLAEICSVYPKSGGLYYWVYEMLNNSPKNQKNATTSAFIAGWSYYLGNIIAIGANNVTVSLSIGSILYLSFDIRLGKVSLMLLALVVTFMHTYLNMYNIHFLSIMNQWNVFWSCAGLILITIILSYFAPHRHASWVFTYYENDTGFDSPIYVFILGMIGAAYSLIGCECVASVNEETQNGATSSSKAIVSSILAAWFVGLNFLIILLFSVQNVDSIIQTTFDMPVAQLFQDAIGTWATLVFLLIIVLCQFCTGASTITVASRQLYALARDGATPISTTLKFINARRLPANAVVFTFVLTCLVILPFPLSEHLFDTIVSAATITIHFSYAMILGCRLIDRQKMKGPFNLGKWSTLINVLGFIWSVFAVFAFLLPTSWPITWDNANYAGIGLSMIILPISCFWFMWGKYHYKGPLKASDELH